MTVTDSHRTPQRSSRLPPLLLIAAGVLAAWALVVAMTGGVRFDIGSLRVSSRDPLRPALLSLLLAVIAWRLAYVDWLEARMRETTASARIAASVSVSIAAACVVVLGLVYGVRAAGGSDPLGYVSESALWLEGRLKIDQSFAVTMPWPHAEDTFIPLGYRPAAGHVMVPTYPPGLPLLMAGTRLISACGPYLIAPISGGLLVAFTYLLGRRYFSRTVASLAAVLTAAAPVVAYMAMSPSTDVPAAMFWMAALYVAGASSGRSAAAGILAGVAVAVRPNLVPTAIFPWLLSILPIRNGHGFVKSTLAYAAGIIPFVALVAWVNAYLYGSPLSSGYGSLSPGFALEYATRNLARYPLWWLQSQGPLAFLFVIGAARRIKDRDRAAAVLMAFAATVFLSYLFYLPFDAWWFLRFLLPAVPIAFLLCLDGVEWLTARLPAMARAGGFLLFTVAMLTHELRFNQQIALTQTGEGEQKYVDAGMFVARFTPPGAVVISMQHSGSIRYYSGRLTLQYATLDPAWLDRAVDVLERSGRPVYVLIDDWEEAIFRGRFEGQRVMARLADGPIAMGRGRQLRFYALGNAPTAQVPPRMPRTSRFECIDISPGFTTAGAISRSR